MALENPPILKERKKGRILNQLVKEFNELPEDEHIKRLFCLQKLNYLLNTISHDLNMHGWINNPKEKGWSKHLEMYGINPQASFFMKGLQFAQAVHKQIKPAEKTLLEQQFQDKLNVDTNKGYEFPLMQERDDLLKNESIEQCEERYKANCYQLTIYSERDTRIQSNVKLHSDILDKAKEKFESVQGKNTSSPTTPTSPTHSYHTKVLGAHSNNNANFEFKMGGREELFVFRVEDRAELGLEQELHSFEVAKHFLEDYAVFTWPFKTPGNIIELKPVVLSQFASQGSLADYATSLYNKNESIANIGPITADYFKLLSHFCLKLMEAKAYHPDIKLTNFLVHKNLIRVSDRKTFVREENPLVHTLRISPEYAPTEIIDCLNEDWTGYNEDKDVEHTIVNMPAVMAYQLGMALKEFLILTQSGNHPDDFRDPGRTAISYFTSVTKETRDTRTVINLSLLAQELTRSEAEKRLSIKQFYELLKFRTYPCENFYQKLEELLPSKTLGIDEDVSAINSLLTGDLAGKELLTQANLIFKKLYTSDSIDHRLTRLAEKLAAKCYRVCGESFFRESISTELLNRDWQVSPWYRQLFHILTFGFYRIDRVTHIEEIKDTMGMNLESEEFQLYFPQLMFLPPAEIESLGKLECVYFKDLVNDNLKKIVSSNPDLQDIDISDEDEHKDQQISTMSLPRETLTLSSSTEEDDEESSEEEDVSVTGTIVILDNKEGKDELSVDKKESLSAEDKETQLPSGTTVIHKKDAQPLPTGTTVIHDGTGNDDAPPKKKEDPVTRLSGRFTLFALPNVASFRTTLLRGDRDSDKVKLPQERIRIKDINFEPPVSDELQQEETTPMLQQQFG